MLPGTLSLARTWKQHVPTPRGNGVADGDVVGTFQGHLKFHFQKGGASSSTERGVVSAIRLRTEGRALKPFAGSRNCQSAHYSTGNWCGFVTTTISISCNCSPHSPPSHPVRWSFTLYVFHRCAAIWVQCHHHILALLARMVLSLVAENTWTGSVCETSRPKVMSPDPCPVTLLWLLRRT